MLSAAGSTSRPQTGQDIAAVAENDWVMRTVGATIVPRDHGTEYQLDCSLPHVERGIPSTVTREDSHSRIGLRPSSLECPVLIVR